MQHRHTNVIACFACGATHTASLCLLERAVSIVFSFFFNDTATTEIYTLSLHDALPIWRRRWRQSRGFAWAVACRGGRRSPGCGRGRYRPRCRRSEEHTSELQSQSNLVCRLLLEKKKKKNTHAQHDTICNIDIRMLLLVSHVALLTQRHCVY